MIKAYYNEFDKYPAQWLRKLQEGKLITEGFVDERSITDVVADDLEGYDRAHFFAGIGGWEYALQLAGWPAEWPVWTGSCPRQPFSQAGKGKGVEDERHLWPEFLRLIAECKPPVVFGEQVASKDGRLWLDGVRSDLEALGYEVGAADMCAASINAPHIRQRLWWVAHIRLSDSEGRESYVRELRDLEKKRRDAGKVATPPLGLVANLIAGYPTPTAQDHSRGVKPPRPTDTGAPLSQMSGYVTPSSRDWKDTPGMKLTGTNPDGSTRIRMDQLPRQAAGMMLYGSPASTEKPGALNPELPRYLMGYPPEWAKFAPTEMPSSRK